MVLIIRDAKSEHSLRQKNGEKKLTEPFPIVEVLPALFLSIAAESSDQLSDHFKVLSRKLH